MSFERVALVFTVNGTRRVRREVGGIGESARNSASAVNFLKSSLGALGGALSARAFVQLSDTAIRLNNQLKLVTTSSDNLRRVTSELYRVARETRSGIEPTVELYSRLQRSTEALNLSQEEVLGMTKSVNQAFQIFGNTADEAEAAMVQFSQGLSSGALRGDELRSVLEQAPRLARAIADGLNDIGDDKLAEAFGQGFKLDDGSFDYKVVIGSLRELGKEGQLTSEKVAAALKAQSDVLNQEFLQTTATIDQAFVLLKNRVIEFLQTEELQRFIGGISAALIRVVDNIQELMPWLRVAAYTFGVLLAVKAIGAAVSAVNALTLALLANPFTAILAGLTIAIALIYEFGDAFAGITSDSVTLKDELVGTFRTISQGAEIAFGYAAELFRSFLGMFSGGTETLKGSWRDWIRVAIDETINFIVFTISSFAGLFGALKNTWDNFPAIVKDAAINAANFLIGATEGGINILIRAYNAIPETAFKALKLVGQYVIDFVVGGFKLAGTAIKNIVKALLNFVVEGFKRDLNTVKRLLNVLPGIDLKVEDSVVDLETLGKALEVAGDVGELAFKQATFNLDEVELGRLQNDAQGAIAGIGDAYQTSFNAANGAARQFFDDLSVRQNQNIQDVRREREERERLLASKSEGELGTLNRTGGIAQGQVGEGFADGSNSNSSTKKIRNPKEISDYVRELDNEYAALQRYGTQREVLNDVNRIAEALQRSRTKTAVAEAEAANGKVALTQQELDVIKAKNFVTRDEIDLLTELVERNIEREKIADKQKQIMDSLNSIEKDYNRTLAAANELKLQGKITDEERLRILRETNAATEARNLLEDIGGGLDDLNNPFPEVAGGAQLESLTLEEEQKNEILKRSFDLNLINQRQYEQARLALASEYARKRNEVETKMATFRLRQGQKTFGDLTKVAEVWAGKQSGIYKALFITEKAFALGSAIIQGQKAIQTAWASAPFPANLPAVAVTTASTAANIATIVGTAVQGFATGGQVLGPGTGTSDSIMAMLSNGEFVINAQATAQFLPLLEAINGNRFRNGGFVGAARVGLPSFASAPAGASSGLPPVSIEINIDTDGSKDGEEQGRRAGEVAFEQFEQLMDSYVEREKRPGGKLENV